MKVLLLMLFAVISHPLLADSITEERLWTEKNGKSFRGIFVRVLDDGSNAEIASNGGKVFTINIDNLVAGDRLLIRSAVSEKKEKEAVENALKNKEDGGNIGFKEPPLSDRKTLVPIRPKTVGSNESDTLLDPLWQFVCWWDTSEVLQIPHKGDVEERMLWAHERLARYCRARQGHSVIRPREAKEGIEKYFTEELGDLATVAVHQDTDFSPTMLKRYCDGINAVILKMTMTYSEGGREYTACAALESIDSKGNAVLHMWGKRKKARFQLKERRPERKMHDFRYLSRAADSYEIVLPNLDGIPDYIAEKGPRFVLDPEDFDTVLIAKPYLFAVKGKRRTPPDDPLFRRRLGAPIQQAKPAAVILPFNFATRASDERTWTFGDNSTFTGSLSFDNDSNAILRDRRGRTRRLHIESLKPEDQACYYFAYGCHGFGSTPPRLELTYRLNTQHGGTYDFVITTRGTLGRIDCIQTDRTLVFDLKDHSFVCWQGKNRRYQGKWRTPESNYYGLNPVLMNPRQDEAEKRATFTNTVKAARRSSGFDFPSRFVQFPVQDTTFRNPKVDFTLMQDPTATVAIYQILHASSPAKRNPDHPKDPNRLLALVFSNATEVSHHRGFKDVAYRFKNHHMLPLRLRWINGVNESWVDEKDRIKTSGKFDFSLIQARVPAEFPEDHFPIPSSARSAEIGTCTRVEQ